ncbi:gluconokinase [Nocardioides massiliensis]|uniref:Gluconokinase n=1 Tax=Nocardioides massiliensis TaxID=1325935 RepID=A0ABT9NPT9_9ACTN|nr:gluconokinase [Nocardioides massiliensis]MDP9822442.1 gluconokinase [Nocardioides massiliensis]
MTQAASPDLPRVVVVMGVSSTGKTKVGTRLARQLGWRFVEGDELHPPANIEKMSAGTPLTDEDRWPWLDAIVEHVRAVLEEDTSVVVTCSALRRSYRDVLRGADPDGSVFFVHLHGTFTLLAERMDQREGHFMPAALLQSQFETLEPLEPDEVGALVDVTPPVHVVSAEAEREVRRGGQQA